MKNKRISIHVVKVAIVIGHLPDEFNDISDIIASMIPRIRPFAYILGFQGRQNKKLKGTFTFLITISNKQKG